MVQRRKKRFPTKNFETLLTPSLKADKAFAFNYVYNDPSKSHDFIFIKNRPMKSMRAASAEAVNCHKTCGVPGSAVELDT